MTFPEPPYFLSNRDWYTTPEDEGIDDFFLKMVVDITLKMMLQKKQKRVMKNYMTC